MLDTPVLFLVFNRPDKTTITFNAIRAARPKRLYVAADGPRTNRVDEKEKVAKVREIVTAVDWSCEVHTLFREKNLGCRRAVSGALSWFFSAEPEGIILEDDCFASPAWFRFAEEMLERYRDDKRVMCVSATHFHGANYKPEYSYFFSRYPHCWGWASWARAWALYDADMSAWPRLKKSRWLRSVGYGSQSFYRYWTARFDQAYIENGVDSWAYRWFFSCWSQNGLTVLPECNLVSNIGYDGEGTHTKSKNTPDGVVSHESIAFPLRHPDRVFPDFAADLWTDQYVYKITPWVTFRGLMVDVVHAFAGRSAVNLARFLWRKMLRCWRYL